MRYKWTSKKKYTYKDVVGHIRQNKEGIYSFRTEVGAVPCDQEWAGNLHQAEVKTSAGPTGRPKVGGTMLPAITVPEQIEEDLAKAAKASGLSVPNLRREAYRQIISKII